MTRKFLDAEKIPPEEHNPIWQKEVKIIKNKQLSDEIAEVLMKLARARKELERVEMRLTIAFEKFSTQIEQERTERCQVCDQTYPDSEIVRRGSEQLCLSCDLDKYPIRNEDIPF